MVVREGGTLENGLSALDLGWTLDCGPRTVGRGLSTLDFGPWTIENKEGLCESLHRIATPGEKSAGGCPTNFFLNEGARGGVVNGSESALLGL